MEESYKKGMDYEAFIRRAYNCSREMESSVDGADCSYMQNLIDLENGKSWVSHLQSVEKQFEEVQTYIVNAIDKFLTKKEITDEQREKLKELRGEAIVAFNSTRLMNVIEVGLEVTHSLKE